MGQYYKPINLKTKEYLSAHNYNNGLKLMEHSYIGNGFVGAVEGLLIPTGAWHKDPIVWAGDYADEEKPTLGITAAGGGKMPTLYGLVYDEGFQIKPNAYTRDPKYRYLVNHTKKEYVDLDAIEVSDNMTIHPLPLLTSEGNGRGGGDFRGSSDAVGTWARDCISIEETIPEEFSEIYGTFTEYN